ncbi:sugar ABC transporter permease [Enterocloster clostridioformis]|uniref:carbohydrate ABC transporter permease n=1 Tax=Enterocloster clostridioformis TaxID=1531 RepID=UPI00080C3638|nr:sugar ABC transporter permease [Enterocloster clostridioformis]ANU44842.1 ABC transporter permease [Lachnoclostridium sp. YL32]NDO27787.1 sugar ABC transporter permease [Enterocloster clostridioformis]OXE70249.1 sugar ABC transporter permease [Enterocloster clostridioformis]QQR00396.1 sugar ABC transporter permease [Enterocloster clostridioformis]
MKALKQQLSKESVAGVLFTLPFTIGFLLFMIVPMGISLYYSFCDYDILSPPVFTGLKNFISMFQDETFFKTLKVTFFFAFVSVPLKLLFALIVAMLLLENSKMSGFYRAAYYLPSIIGGSVAVSILWKRMFAMNGVVNKLLGMVGIQTSFSWLGDTRTAIWVLILLVVWQFGSSMLIFLSSLKQVPQSLYEAAEVDGASAPAKFFKITLPLLTPTIFFNLVMQMINGFLAFTQCYIITQGKPMNSTLLYTVYMYKQSFEFYNTGYGAALAWVMLAVIGLITLFLFATKRFWVYEGGL